MLLRHGFWLTHFGGDPRILVEPIIADQGVTVLTEIDVSKPAEMRVVRTERIRGTHVSSRLTGRTARVVVSHEQPHRTTAQARAMGITTRVGRYETIYGGDPNRIHNVQLVARLIDGKLIAPGATFSFNNATGARTADKGFREAPVIINGELTTGLGGGVCQVSTTVFNAAFEAGVPIESRTNHALYISHYPQGRDATVNYPDTDLKFRNDTGRWLLLRAFVGSSALTVNVSGYLYPASRILEVSVVSRSASGVPDESYSTDFGAVLTREDVSTKNRPASSRDTECDASPGFRSLGAPPSRPTR